MLPTIVLPTHIIIQPSTKKELKFRPYLVKEEKLLLMAKESKDIKDIFNTVKQIVGACCLEKKFEVDNIPLFDLEILFLRLRSFSVNSIEKFSATDNEDQKEYQFIINFNDIEVKFPDETFTNKIKVTDKITILMKYPSSSIYDKEDVLDSLKKNGIFELVLECVDKIYDGDTLLTFSKDELHGFLDNLDIKTFEKIKNFLVNMPKLEYKLEYTNSLGHNRQWAFNSLMDFFLYL
jgi:hypothetical protein